MAHITEKFRNQVSGGAGSSYSNDVIRILSPAFSSALLCINFILRKISPYNGSEQLQIYIFNLVTPKESQFQPKSWNRVSYLGLGPILEPITVAIVMECI